MSVDRLHAGQQEITATLVGEILKRSVARGCLQGYVLSPLTWTLVVDELIRGLNVNGCYTLGYADDIAISRKSPSTISELLQEGLNTAQQWCDRTELFINPQKMVIVPFTRKRFKGPKGTNTLWTHIAADNRGKIPWTYSGQGIDKEGTAEKCDK
jgi:hypothetical protein